MPSKKHEPPICCNCGMEHGPGYCARMGHFVDMAVRAFNLAETALRRVEALERAARRRRKEPRRG